MNTVTQTLPWYTQTKCKQF